MAEPGTSLNQELTALSECFKKAELSYGKILNQPSQINAQKQLPRLLKLIFASNKIEDLLENYVLIQKIKESEEDESFDIQSARIYYRKLLEKE